MKQPKGLGRGLDAIFGTDAVDAKLKPMSQMTEIDIAEIIPNPTQPRTQFDEEALDELADSIRQLGIIQPITVKKSGDGKYIIISGERRWRAAQRADLKSLPAYVREVDDENLHAMALVENIQRQDLNAIEIALGMQRLIEECNLTQDALSEKVGKKRSTVSNYMRLLKLPDEVQLALKEGLISMGHAKAIAGAPQELQLRTLKKILKKSLSVRQAEELGTHAHRAARRSGTKHGGRRVSRKLFAAGGTARKVLLAGNQHQTLEKRRRTDRHRLRRRQGHRTIHRTVLRPPQIKYGKNPVQTPAADTRGTHVVASRPAQLHRGGAHHRARGHARAAGFARLKTDSLADTPRWSANWIR